ncbi:MAG TPA: GtrA family protein [Patescibacteria group bacterium]|nr:GtrA family protein [Patescibacteria group bacterium]
MSRVNTIAKFWRYRVVRFACVGVFNTLLDLTILNALVFIFDLKVLVANTISASISVVISYFLNHAIVFQKQHKMTVRLFLKFITVTGLSILLVQSVVIYAAEHFVTTSEIVRLTGFSDAHAKFVQVNGAKAVAVLLGMAWNFALYHLVVFRHSDAQKTDAEEEAVLPY